MQCKDTYMIPMKIAGIGIALPKQKITSEQLEEQFSLESGWCERHQGIKSRYWISDDETNTTLCTSASEEAIKNAGITIDEIDCIINACNTNDSFIPDQTVFVNESLGIKRNIPFMSISVGCLNYIQALDIAGNLIASGKYKTILILSTLIASKGFFNKDDVLSVSMLADASAATVVTKTPENENSCIKSVFSQTYSDASDVSTLNGDKANKTFFSKDVKEEDIYFRFDAKMMQASGAKYNRGFIDRLMGKNNKDVDWVIPNQSTKLAVDMMRLMFGKSKVMSVVEEFGNIGAVGYPIAMYYAIKEGRLNRGESVLLSGIGAGLSLAGVLLRF